MALCDIFLLYQLTRRIAHENGMERFMGAARVRVEARERVFRSKFVIYTRVGLLPIEINCF